MKYLTIRGFGPIKSAELQIDRIALVIGMQSSGKSSLLKMAAFCSWVEKRIMVTQSDKQFVGGKSFIQEFADYYGHYDYFQPNTLITYSSSYLSFVFDNGQTEQKFSFKWQSHRWDYRRPKVQYIPSERNIASLIPKWQDIPVRKSLSDFLTEWDNARRQIGKEEDMLQLGYSYTFDPATGTDSIRTSGGKPFRLTDGSSGLQSLVPMYLLIDYLWRGQYMNSHDSQQLKPQQRMEREYLLSELYLSAPGKAQSLPNKIPFTLPVEKNIEGKSYYFQTQKDAVRFENRCQRFLFTDHSELFLEEPEQNLFPPTQGQLIDWLYDMAYDSKHSNTLMISTHSPYILNALCKLRRKDMSFYVTHPDEEASDMFKVKQLSVEEIDEIYNSGTDLFFNYAAFV